MTDGGPDSTRRLPQDLRQLVREARFLAGLRRLPFGVARFQWRAHKVARQGGDSFSLASATRPASLALLLRVAGRRTVVAELGTATGWSAISLALAHPTRHVVSFDPHDRPERRRYLELVGPDVRRRVEFVTAPGSAGPPAGVEPELLYVDSSHEQAETVAEARAWMPSLHPGALVLFDDYGHPEYPGVERAVAELGLTGRRLGSMFVHEVGASDAPVGH